jgi:hypothetical protein
MPSDPSAKLGGAEFQSADEAWREIEGLVEDATNLARLPMSDREFYVELLNRLMQATGAAGCAGWSCDPRGGLRQTYEIGAEREHSRESTLAMRAELLSSVLAARKPRLIMPQTSAAGIVENSLEFVTFAHPLRLEDESIGALELFHAPDCSPSELKNVEHLVAVFAEIAVEFHRNRQFRELRNREQGWSQLEQFAEAVHASLDLDLTCYSIANEAARVTGCDRVAVVRGPDAGCRVVAVSGLDSINRRSNQLRALTRLAKAVAKSQESLWYAGEEVSLPAQIERALQSYLDASHVRSLAVVPLIESASSRRAATVGILVCESFEATPWTDAQRGRIETVCRHGRSALRNSLELHRLPLISLSRIVQRLLWLVRLRQIPKTLMCILLLAGVVAAMIFAPADFVIRGQGELRPQRYQHVFAPASGVIREIKVDHADPVTAGETLIELQRPELDYEIARVRGDLDTNQTRLDTVTATLLNYSRRESPSADEFDDLTSEEGRLKVLVASLEQQREILNREKADLTVTSPFNGEVLTWKVRELLKSRPVHHGERLLSVADPNGPWLLEMRIADHDVEHVLAAHESSGPLLVSFVVASHSGETYTGVIECIATATDMDHETRPSVLITVGFDQEQLSELRPGTTVFAKLHCGRRPIGYVWFRELFEVVRTRLLF